MNREIRLFDYKKNYGSKEAPLIITTLKLKTIIWNLPQLNTKKPRQLKLHSENQGFDINEHFWLYQMAKTNYNPSILTL